MIARLTTPITTPITTTITTTITAAALALAFCVGAAPGRGGLAAADAAPDAAESRTLSISFADVDGPLADGDDVETLGSADVEATLHTSPRGRARQGTGPRGGSALALPRFDPEAPVGGTRVAVLGVTARDTAADPLSPEDSGFTFGASFRLSSPAGSSEADNGENLVQRGSFADASQYKLQVDRGRPSCRVSGADGTVLVVADRHVDLDQWYAASCHRSRWGVALVLVTFEDDGTTSRQVWKESGATGSMAGLDPTVPLSVGGKLDARGAPVLDSPDQLNGTVDNVFLEIKD